MRKIKAGIWLLCLLSVSCSHQTQSILSPPLPGTGAQTAPSNTGKVPPSASSGSSVPTGGCVLEQERLELANQTADLPKFGRFVLESHLVTVEDGLSGWPRNTSDKILPHLDAACRELRKQFAVQDCAMVYNSKDARVWTPAEPTIGQGSTSQKPTTVQEMWSGNMYWTSKSKPAPTTKFLACANQKCVVVNMAFETGPRDKVYLGGLQREPHWFLGTNNESKILFGRLKDQSVKLGPINCN